MGLKKTKQAPGASPMAIPIVFRSCEAQLEQARMDAFAVHQTWGTTASGTREATAHITARIPVEWVDPPNNVHLEELPCFSTQNDNICVAALVPGHAGGLLIVGCDSIDCAPEIVLSVEACGTQTITSGYETVTYAFTGYPGCMSISLTINGQDSEIQDIPLRLDARSKGQGGGVWTSSLELF